MTPLQRFVAGVRDEIGAPEMARRAWDEKRLKISPQRIGQIINDPPARLTASMVEKLAAACGVRPMAIAMLEDEGYFLAPAQDQPVVDQAAANE